MRRALGHLPILFAVIGIIGADNAVAQSYPNRPVTVIVPFAAGGSVDATARLVTPKLAERLKQPVIVENVAGAAGTIGTQRVVRSPPDGHTLLFAVTSPIIIGKLVSPATVKYDALKDLVPISMVGTSPFVLVGKPDFPAANTAELLKLARGQPGKLSYATDGVGTSMHLTGELIKQRVGVNIEHVPYKLGPQILTDLQGSQLELAILPLVLVQSPIKSGKLKGFGVTSKERWSTAPDIPALAETPELKDFELVSWYGLFAPAGTNASIVTRLVNETGSVLQDPELVKRMSDLALVPSNLTSDQFAAYLRKEQQDFARIVAAGNIKTE
jgi:tripartite-type tricarboxylate transporter receptor subunit TctC